MSNDQAEIVAALASGEATGEGHPLRRIDTHMSHLFLGDERAYKLKRSLRHVFSDMSSVEARRAACESELEVNQAVAPGLYQAVLPVARDQDGALRVGAAGPPLDWVVAMQRFPDGALLSDMADAGRLTPALVSEAATTIARFHGAQPPTLTTGHAADYRRIIASLQRTEAAGAEAIGALPASSDLFAALDRALTRVFPLIEARREAGWVRRGHGDLHLRNICLFKCRITPFDALEFDPRLATADVLYDTAFLLMDLKARGLGALTNMAMNTYWDEARQPEDGLALLPFFMALRAAVRMAIAVEGGDLTEAEDYRQLGLDLLRPAPARLVAIGGLSGTGKSTLARAIAPELPGPCGARLLRTDRVRKSLAGVSPQTRLDDSAYAPAARARVYEALALDCRLALRAGASVVADGTFRDAVARAGVRQAAGDHPFLGVWLRAPGAGRIARVAARRGDVSDATAQVAGEQLEPDRLEAEWRTVDADRPAETVAASVRALLGA